MQGVPKLLYSKVINNHDFDQLRLQQGDHISILELKDSIIKEGESP